MYKGGIITLYEKILREHENLEKQIKLLQEQLRSLPEGKLIFTHSKGYYKWYQSDGKALTYLPKRQRPLAEKLALKKFLSLELEDAIHEKTALDFYLRHHDNNSGKARKLLVEIPEFQALLSSHFYPQNKDLNHWMQSAYERNPKHPEQLTHQTGFGYAVRSKSELLIDYVLRANNIPFRYECALELGGNTIYPDFTILHPQTGELIYWEHFGMMDDPAYYKNVFSKLNLYAANGILPNINLITTYETKEIPLDTKQINDMINMYLQ